MKYNSYLINPEPLIKAYEFYSNNNITQKEVCKKFKVNYHSFKSYINKMRAGTLQKRSFNVEITNNNEYVSEKKDVQSIFKKKESEKKDFNNENLMEIMRGARGRRSGRSGLTDMMEDANKKANRTQTPQPKKKNVVSLENMYNISGMLNEADRIAKEND